MPQLTRAEMENVIRGGGSVLYGGRTLTQIAHLPTEADLAQGDPEAETAAANAIQQQIADLQSQLARLTPPSATEMGVPPVSPSDDPIVHVVGRPAAIELAGAGYATPEQLRQASDEQLLAVAGIGDATLRKIRQAFGGGE